MQSNKSNPSSPFDSLDPVSEDGAAYRSLEASLLYCPKCLQAMPVRKRLLLILPEGEKYEYLCSRCSSTCGTKVEPARPPVGYVAPVGMRYRTR